MAFRATKVVSTLPGTLTPSTLYLVRTGAGFDLYASDSTGSIAYPLNPTSVGAAVHAATGKTTPVDADELALVDSAASWALKKLTWANLRTAVQGFLGGLYGKSNILGTVSQSGGVPTGAIVERGSNANGEYIRFADGTQICTFVQASNSAITTSLTTNLYACSPISMTFPAAFAANPVCLVAAANSANAPAWSNSGAVSTTGVAAVYLFSYSNVATARAAYVAVGRWF